MSNFVQVTPFLHVADVGRAVAFFTDILGFEALIHARDYAYVHRETVGFRILEQSRDDGPPPAGNRRFAYYIDVRDVDRSTPSSSRSWTRSPRATCTGR